MATSRAAGSKTQKGGCRRAARPGRVRRLHGPPCTRRTQETCSSGASGARARGCLWLPLVRAPGGRGTCLEGRSRQAACLSEAARYRSAPEKGYSNPSVVVVPLPPTSYLSDLSHLSHSDLSQAEPNLHLHTYSASAIFLAGVCPEKQQCSHMKPRVAEQVQRTETGPTIVEDDNNEPSPRVCKPLYCFITVRDAAVAALH